MKGEKQLANFHEMMNHSEAILCAITLLFPIQCGYGSLNAIGGFSGSNKLKSSLCV